MRTSDFIAALAADPVAEPVDMRRRFAAALALGLVGALALYALFVGPRPDFAEAVGHGPLRSQVPRRPRARPAVAALACPPRAPRRQARRARALAFRAARPSRPGGVGGARDHAVRRVDDPPRRAQHALLHDDDPDDGRADPGGADRRHAGGRAAASGQDGALAGAASAGLAAFLYASHCPDDLPLFVATWYPLATLICAAAGALAGRLFSPVRP